MTSSLSADSPGPRKVTILGIGLLGGSVAKAYRHSVPGVAITGYSRRPMTRQRALEIGVIDHASDSVAAACAHADVVVVATPVTEIAGLVKAAAAASPPECLVTDVGSTKGKIVTAVTKCDVTTRKFVPAHPIAGSEKTGVDNATASLFRGKAIVLTPLAGTTPPKVEAAREFWNATGGVIHSMSPEHHDRLLAAVSHVPHLVAALVAELAPDDALPLVGSGWCDITRVAAGDPAMWTAICQHNRDAIVEQLDLLIDQAVTLRARLHGGQDAAVDAWFEQAKARRDSIDS